MSLSKSVLGRPVNRVSGRRFLSHSVAPLELMAEHGAHPQTALTCPICGSFFAVSPTGGYTVWRPVESFECPAGDGPVRVLTGDTGESRGIAMNLSCELGHRFSLHVLQLFSDEPLCLDLIPADETYEAFPDQLYEDGRNADDGQC